jgi:hypothetical protein
MGGLEADAGGMSFGVWDREEFGSVVTVSGSLRRSRSALSEPMTCGRPLAAWGIMRSGARLSRWMAKHGDVLAVVVEPDLAAVNQYAEFEPAVFLSPKKARAHLAEPDLPIHSARVPPLGDTDASDSRTLKRPPPLKAGALQQRRRQVSDRQRRPGPSSCRSWTRSGSGSPSGSLASMPDPMAHMTAPAKPTQLPISALSSDCRSAAPGTSMIHATH